eukprot:5651225-Prymnesium_polylepis.2
MPRSRQKRTVPHCCSSGVNSICTSAGGGWSCRSCRTLKLHTPTARTRPARLSSHMARHVSTRCSAWSGLRGSALALPLTPLCIRSRSRYSVPSASTLRSNDLSVGA